MAHCIRASGDLARGGRCSADMDSVCFSGAITRWIAGESHSDDEPPPPGPPPGPEPVAELGGVEHASTTSSAAPMTSTVRLQLSYRLFGAL